MIQGSKNVFFQFGLEGDNGGEIEGIASANMTVIK